MNINTINPVGESLQPRAILQVGGTVIDWTTWKTSHNGIFEAGTAHITIPATPDKWSWWTQQAEIVVDIYAGFPIDPVNYTTNDLTNLFTLRVDLIEIDAKMQIITLSGRDLTSLLIDKKTSAKYQNQTSSQIAAILAAQVGLQTQITPTTSLVSGYYSTDHVLMQSEQTPWALLQFLAQREGMQCFVQGRTLYFGHYGPQTQGSYLIKYEPPTAAVPYAVCNAVELALSHDLTLSPDINVRVRSFHGTKNQAYSFTVTAQKGVKRIERDAKLAQTIPSQYDVILPPGKTLQEVTDKAYEVLGELSKHEFKLNATLPGDVLIYPWTVLELQGTGTDFDTRYTCARVDREMTIDAPKFEVSVTCKSIPISQTVSL